MRARKQDDEEKALRRKQDEERQALKQKVVEEQLKKEERRKQVMVEKVSNATMIVLGSSFWIQTFVIDAY